MGQTGIQIRGSEGRLLEGSRPAAYFGAWEAYRPAEAGGPWRIIAQDLRADPLYYEVGEYFRARLAVGRGEVRGRAGVVSGEEGGTLVLEMEIDTDG